MQTAGRDSIPTLVSTAYEATFRFHASDLLRLGAIFLVPLAWMSAGSAAAAAMALVAGGTCLLRYYAGSRAQDLTGQVVFVSAGLFSMIGLYQAIWWLDLAVHLILMAVVTVLINDILVHRKGLTQRVSQAQQRNVTFVLLTYGSLAAVLWEVGEWVGYYLVSQEIGVGILDSMTDILAGILGILGAVYWISSSRKFQ